MSYSWPYIQELFLILEGTCGTPGIETKSAAWWQELYPMYYGSSSKSPGLCGKVLDPKDILLRLGGCLSEEKKKKDLVQLKVEKAQRRVLIAFD